MKPDVRFKATLGKAIRYNKLNGLSVVIKPGSIIEVNADETLGWYNGDCFDLQEDDEFELLYLN